MYCFNSTPFRLFQRTTAMCAMLCLSLAWHSTVCAQATPTPSASVVASPVKDLSYGDALFYFYSGDYFASATRLLVAQKQQTLTHHSDDASLLLGGLYLSYGQQNDAADIFSSLLSTTQPGVRDRAWLYLAEIAWQRGNNERANSALNSIGDDLADEFIARRQLLEARLAIDEQRFDQAIAVLGDWQGGKELAAYAQFNLGVALIRHGRVDEGTRFLQDVGSGKVRVPGASRWNLLNRLPFFSSRTAKNKITADESQALRDRANLALGFAHLQNKQAAQALGHLREVNTESALYSKARLGSGWAASELGNYSEALLYWELLQSRDHLDPAVQEALLAVPYANRYLGKESQAIAQYQQAIEQFEQEISNLNTFKEKLDHGAFIESLLEDDSVASVGWFWQLKSIPNSAESRYLYHMVADHAFQEGLKNYRDLLFLQNNLRNWQSNMVVYRNMVEAQRSRYGQQMSDLPGAGTEQQLNTLRERLERAQAQLDRVKSSHDTVALATADEQKNWQRIERAGQLLDSIDSPRATEARDKHRVLRGVMLWEFEQQYSARAWQATKDVKKIETELRKAVALRQSLSAAMSDSPNRFIGFDERIDALSPRINTLLKQIDSQLGQHQSYLAELAGEQFENHKKRLTAYLAEAQFALASAYDKSARSEDGS